MKKKQALRPTEAELEILQVLWEQGPATVRQVHEQLLKRRKAAKTGYTTVLKLMQIMTEKQLVTRDESQRSHIYAARARQAQTQKALLKDLMRRAFSGSANQLVLQALQSQKISTVEIDEIRSLLDELEGETP